MKTQAEIPNLTSSNPLFLAAKRIEDTLQLLSKEHGLPGLDKMLENLKRNTTVSLENIEDVTIIKDFIAAQAIAVFHLDIGEFYTNETTDYREARMICYNLLDVYTKCSHDQIGRIFNGRSKQSIQRYCQRCKEVYLSLPQFYKGFCYKYELIEAITIQFLGKFNIHEWQTT